MANDRKKREDSRKRMKELRDAEKAAKEREGPLQGAQQCDRTASATSVAQVLPEQQHQQVITIGVPQPINNTTVTVPPPVMPTEPYLQLVNARNYALRKGPTLAPGKKIRLVKLPGTSTSKATSRLDGRSYAQVASGDEEECMGDEEHPLSRTYDDEPAPSNNSNISQFQQSGSGDNLMETSQWSIPRNPVSQVPSTSSFAFSTPNRFMNLETPLNTQMSKSSFAASLTGGFSSQFSAVNFNSSAGSNFSTPVTNPKKRGRPSNPAIESDSSESSTASTSTKRGRGRPKGASNSKKGPNKGTKKGPANTTPSTRPRLGGMPFSDLVNADGTLARIRGPQFLDFDDGSDDDTSTIDNTQNEAITQNEDITQGDDRMRVEIDVPSQLLMPPPPLPIRGRSSRSSATTQESASLRRSSRIADLRTTVRVLDSSAPTYRQANREMCPPNELQNRTARYIAKHKPITYKLNEVPKLSGGEINQRCKQCRHPNVPCASTLAKHKVEAYQCGGFTKKCPYCAAKLTESELNDMKQNRWGKCCAYGQVHTKQMQEEYKELMETPEELRRLALYRHDEESKNFLENTLPLNSSMAFGSVSVGKMDPNDPNFGSRKDTCKLNGEFTFRMSDLYCKEGQKPLFGQAYCLDPETACNLREENFTRSGLPTKIKKEVIKTLDKMLRHFHPFSTAFNRAHQIYKQHQDQGHEIPKFQLTILTNRELQDPILVPNPEIQIVRNNQPAQNQVAVIWINDDGLAHDITGIWLDGKEGRTVKLPDEDPNLDPACFPLLFPKGTQGYRFGMKKGPDLRPNRRTNPQEREQRQMEEELEGTDSTAYGSDDATVDLGRYERDIGDEAQSIYNVFGLDTGDDTVVVPDIDTAEQEENRDEEETAEFLLNGEPDRQRKKKEQKKKEKGCPEDNISMRQFWRYRTFYRKYKAINRKVEKDREFHWVWTMRKLAEFFLISVLNRVERNEMKWAKMNQEGLRKVLATDYVKAMERGIPEGGTLGEVFFTPASFQGSRQYYQKSYADLMTLCRRLGQPTFFVTFTGNPTWPEIVEALPEGQEYVNRADIVCRIWIDYAKEFIKDVTERGKLGKVAGFCYSVEHQKRGMPHLHLLLILDKDAPENKGLGTPEFVNQFISARIPQLPHPDDMSDEAKQQRRLWDAVTSMNLHDCDSKAPCRYEKLDKDGKPKSMCNKRFPKDYTSETVLSSVRYTQYVRRAPQETADPDVADVNAELDPDNREPFDPVTEYINWDQDGNPHVVNEEVNPDNDPENGTQYRRLLAPEVAQGEEAIVRAREEPGMTFYKMKNNTKILLTDQHVVPYNEFLLLKYGCHINIEYVFGQKACKYIFKYILKGHEQAYVKVGKTTEGSEVYDYDEIAATFKVRYMTSMEAYLRLFGYPIVHNSHTFVAMPVIIPDTEVIIFEEGHEGDARRQIGKMNKLTGFFDLCSRDDEHGEEARKWKYNEIETHFWWDKESKPKQWVRRKRKIGDKLLIRLHTVSPKNAQLFAARALLLEKRGPTSYIDLCTVRIEGKPDEVCLTPDGKPDFITAAQKMNLLTNDHVLTEVLNDAADNIMNARRLQNYFATLLNHQNPSNAKQLFEDFLDQMYTPRLGIEDRVREREERKQTVLNNLEYYFRRFGTTCKNIGLDAPANYNHHQMQEQIEADEFSNFSGGDRNVSNHWKKLADDNIVKMKDNPDQLEAFNRVMGAINNDGSNKLIFLEGPGGCGKTFLYNTLIAQMKHEKRKVVACASTAIAALLLIGGATAHRSLRIPSDDFDRQTAPRFSYDKEDSHYLRDTELIVIDEISMLHRDVLHYIDRSLQSVMPLNHPDKKKPFGGKTVILGGDWKQLLPVVVGGNKADQIGACIKREEVFKNFRKIRLTKNMRADADQLAFCEWLKEVGTGKNMDAKGEITFKPENTVNNMKDLIDFTFQDVFTNPLEKSDLLCDAAILNPKNDGVHEINEYAMKLMPGTAREYLSIDQPLPSGEELDHYGVHASDFNIEAVHEETPSGLPPHKLELKIGAPVMIIRNFDVARNLCNGTRLQIIKMTEHNLICKVLTGPTRGQTEYIPKISIMYGKQKNHRGLRFERYQFPIRPCFAMTTNKAQGQTLKRVGLALNRQQCFAHGQIYVAVSRVTRMEGIRVYTTTSSAPNKVKNIVYKEVLEKEDLNPAPAQRT